MKKIALILILFLSLIMMTSCKGDKNMIVIELMDGREIKLELYPDVAPETVKHFYKLIKAKHFDNVIFHRVIEGFMIQAGALVYDGQGLDYNEKVDSIKGEFTSNGFVNNLKHEEGVISMARTNDPNSASGQFFICSDTSPHLDGSYAAFGRTVDQESLDVVKDISRVETVSFSGFNDFPAELVIIKTIKRL